MKQFVGLYAVGEAPNDPPLAITLPTPATGIYLNSLYCTPKFIVSPMLAIPLLPETKGLYIGIISQGAVREVKIIPVLHQNEELLASLLAPDVLEQCITTMGVLFGLVEEGEATPAYVNQDQS